MGPLVFKVAMVVLVTLGIGWHALPAEAPAADETQIQCLDVGMPPAPVALSRLALVQPQAPKHLRHQIAGPRSTPPCGLRAPPA